MPVGLALPVGAGDREQLERADLAGVGDVRAAAEVDELALAVEAEDAVLVQLVVDVLDLEPWPRSSTNWRASGDGQAEPLERLGVLDDPGHLGLDRREVVLGEGPVGQVDVVVEAVGRGRAEGEPRAGEEPQDGPGHDVARSSAAGRRAPRGPWASGGGARSAWSVPFLERAVEVDDRAVGHGGDGRVGEPLADPLGDLARADALGVLLDRPVRQLDLDHRTAFHPDRGETPPPTDNAGSGVPRVIEPVRQFRLDGG